jgi:hypothetical protein
MCFCKYCDGKIDLEDAFCSHCGEKVVRDMTQGKEGVFSSSSSNNNMSSVPTQKEKLHRLCCELAYVGTLFWLPLVFCPQQKNAKYHANQGLWILILSVISCWGIRILRMINSVFAGSLFGIICNGIYSLFFILFLCFMMYLLVNCLKSARQVHQNIIPESILFFEERAIIK